jgi:MFS family permease
MAKFTVIWAGQVVSLLGTAMTQFALMVWVWNITEQATATALMGFFAFVPQIAMTPIAGALVDRWDRKKTMIISDLTAGIGSLVILVLYSTAHLQVWHLYIIGLFAGAFGAFQWPAYSAAITMLVEKKDYARADGMMGIAEALSMIAGPPAAAVLMVFIGISGILTIDIMTFCFAIGVLLVVDIPNPPRNGKLKKGLKGIFKDSAFGFRYIYRKKPLFALTLVFFTYNLIAMFGMMVLGPCILARTGKNQEILGALMAVLGIGGIIGGLFMAVWGGPKRRINGLLGGMVLSIIVGIAILPTNYYVWAAGGFFMAFLGPISNGCSQAIWQTKTPPQLQGRIFGARRFIAQISSIIGMISVGPLADRFFTPAMMPGGSLTGTFGWMVHPGPGTGMALMIFFAMLLCTVASIIAYTVSTVRNVEDLIPDQVQKIGKDGVKGKVDGKDRKNSKIENGGKNGKARAKEKDIISAGEGKQAAKNDSEDITAAGSDKKSGST